MPSLVGSATAKPRTALRPRLAPLSIRRRPLPWILVLLLPLLAAPTPAGAASLPAGFSEALVASGLARPTAMALAPDGRIFVCEQGGRLRVIKNGALLATPFVSLTVDSGGERGLLGVAFDPLFATNHFVYVYYTATTPTTHNRVSRFTANGDVALAGETVLLDLENLNAGNHNGGAIHFGIDGKLYVAVGENGVAANSQALSNRLGKILRVNADGSIPSDNPFFTTATGLNRSIWALGLRNPFTFAFQPVSGRMFINDVGQSAFEEINDGIAGANYGWPITEGPTDDVRFNSPLYAYGHSDGCAIAGGAFYNPPTGQFPNEYVGAYFFAELCGGWIRRRNTDGSVVEFATGITQPVDLLVADDGSLLYLARGNGDPTGVVYRVGFDTSQPAVVTSPAPGSTLQTTTQTFAWNAGVGVTAFWLDVGTTRGGYEIFEGYVGTSRSWRVSGIPRNGGPLWVRLRSLINGAYQFRDFQYVTAASVPSRIVAPAAGATLPGATSTFAWDAGLNVQFYWVDVGDSQGGYNYYSNYVGTSQSLTVSGLPVDGRAIWVRLLSFIDGRYQFVDHRFTAGLPGPARIASPAVGSTLGGTRQTFTWNPGTGASFYWLNVGRTQGGYELYSNYVGNSLSLTLTNLPIDGGEVWVRLMSYINGAYQFVDHRFVQAVPTPSRIVSPTPGTNISTTTRTFAWNAGVAVTSYWLNVGTSQGGYELYSNFVGTEHQWTVSGLPIGGNDIWVRLYSRIGNEWVFVDHRFTTP